jgi:pimeloyl-ACP methyl ester carboxylesterase
VPPYRVSAAPDPRTGVDRDLRWLEVASEGRDGDKRQALILVPAHGPPGRRYPALLLLHGRGEVGDARAGMHAWRTRYGLADSYAQLRRPPLALDPERAAFMQAAQLEALNTQLAKQPFAGLVLICPVTPNPHTSPAREQLLDDYADWIERALLPHVASVAPVAHTTSLGVDGCSMGGYVAAELCIRKPHLFKTFGVVQPALGEFRVSRFAERLAVLAAQPGFAGIHLQTSSEDPYRGATEAFSRELTRLQTPHDLEVLPGPHTQAWLRAAGTLTMLAWHERRLRLPYDGTSPPVSSG